MHHASNVTNIYSIPTHISEKNNEMCDVILTFKKKIIKNKELKKRTKEQKIISYQTALRP
jgi:hypothetical protein